MNNIITANELKTKGISVADSFAEQGLETYELKEHELMAALEESENDLKNGKYKRGSIEDHTKRMINV